MNRDASLAPLPLARLLAAVVSGIVLGFAAASAHAIDRHWNAASGLWIGTGNWSPSGVPQPADNAILDYFSGGSAGSAVIGSTAVPAVTSATVMNGGTVSMRDARSGGVGSLLCGTDFVVGRSSTGGVINVMNSSGPFAPPFPGGLTIAGNLRLGVLSGSGTVNQNAGTVGIGDTLFIADSNLPGSEFKASGAYNLSGGRLRAPAMVVGWVADGAGTFNLSGSATAIINEVFVGGISRSLGTIRQTGGSLVISGQMRIGTSVSGGGGDSYHMNSGSLSSDFTVLEYGTTFNYFSGFAYVGDLWLASTPIGTQGARLTLSAGGDKTLRAFRAHIDDDAVIDLNDNRMTISLHSAGQSREFILRGYNGGSWTGDGITSSAAAAVAASGSPHRTALGYNNNLIRYTYCGDATLDGKVDVADLGRLATAWQSSGYWYEGDFNYDGLVNIGDLGLLATNWQIDLANPPLGPSPVEALAALGLGAASVPEPACLIMLLAALACPRLCRNRSKRARPIKPDELPE